MKKRLIALLLATAILLSTVPAAAADSSLALQSMQSGRCGSAAAWTLNLDTGTLRILGFGAMDDFESYKTEVPWYAYRNSIQTVAVGIGITSIGVSAFRDCTNLTRVSLSNTVKRIESCAFMGSPASRRLSFPTLSPGSVDRCFTTVPHSPMSPCLTRSQSFTTCCFTAAAHWSRSPCRKALCRWRKLPPLPQSPEHLF